MTSTKELRQRLATFLAEPDQEQDFRAWFALVLQDVHKSDPATETLAHDIMWAFYDQRRGLCTPSELMCELTRLATDSGVQCGELRPIAFSNGCVEPFPVKSDTTSTGLQEAAPFVLEASQVDVGFASVSS